MHDGSFLSFDYNYIENMDWVDTRESHMTRKLDVQYSHHFRLVGQDARLAINLENVLGDYTEYQDENVLEPGGHLRFSVNFH